MAFEAFVGKDGPDIKIIADFSRISGTCVVAVRVEAGGKDENTSCDQGQYDSNTADGDRFNLKIIF